MKVAVDARPLCVPTFGIGRYLQSLMKRLVNEDIEWFLYADRPLLFPIEAPNVTIREHASTHHLLSLVRSQYGFARWAREDNVDVFWSPRHHLPLALPAQIKSVVTIHDLVWKRFPETMLAQNLFVERVLMPPALRRADAVIAVSNATRDDLVADYPRISRKITVIPEAAEPFDVEDAAAGEPYFVFLGTLEPRKNLTTLLRAFDRARGQLPSNCRLKILGAKGWQTEIDALLAGVDCRDVIDVLGHVDDRTLHETLAGAIALCLPSLYEGFGLPALEAMQHGTPVIGSNVSSIPEVVGESGLLVAPTDVAGIAQAMIRLVTEDGLREKLSAAARQQAQTFSWERAASETAALLRSV